MELDPTLTGVIIGGAVGVLGPLLTSLTQILSHWLTGKREDKKWAREQTAAEEKRIGEEKQEKLKETHEIFLNSLRLFTMRLEDLTESQRILLANIYFPDFKQIPEVTRLPMPSSPRPNRTHTWGLDWKGKFNPATTAPSEIIRMWEVDYNEAHNKAVVSKAVAT